MEELVISMIPEIFRFLGFPMPVSPGREPVPEKATRERPVPAP